jgi:predicted membrane channel-forming protein YqfA (hemolysin III family)
MYLKGLIVIIIFVIIGITEIVPLKRNKNKKELTIYTLFFVAAFALMFLYSIDVELPRISKGINSIIEKII